jgi:predicted membrane channel-forming protein YqfA (hemolysin III family)
METIFKVQRREVMQRFREPVNGFTHVAGAVLAAISLIWLVLVTQNNTQKMLSIIIYGISMVFSTRRAPPTIS